MAEKTTQSNGEELFLTKLNEVVSSVKSNAKTPGEVSAFFEDLQNLPPQERVSAIVEMSDQLAIQKIKKDEPIKGRAGAAVAGFSDSALFGLPQMLSGAASGLAATGTLEGAKQGLGEAVERSRLLQKAFPAESTAANVVGLFKGPGAGLFVSGAKFGGIAAKVASDKIFQKKMADIIGQHFVTQVTAQGAAGVGSYALANSGVKNLSEVVTGEKEFGQAVKDTVLETADATLKGGALAGGFAAGGFAAYKAGQALGNAAKQGMNLLGKYALGKDIRFQSENLELVREIMAKSPESVIAESAEKIAPIANKIRNELRATELQAKNEVLTALGNRSIQLEGELAETAKKINQSVAELRKANEVEIARSASKLDDAVGKAYAQINAKYGKELQPILEGPVRMVQTEPILDIVEKELKSNRAMDKSGRLLPSSDWAKTNPELFQDYGSIWSRLGGSVRSQGGKEAINVNLKDALEIKKDLGSKAGFGKQATNYERGIRNVFYSLGKQTEIAEPRLTGINKEYAQSRSKIDDFRSALGKKDTAIQTRLKRILNDDRILFKEAVEGLAQVTPDAVDPLNSALSSAEKIKFLTSVQKNPKAVFSQIRKAYVDGDPFLSETLDTLGRRFPKLEPYITVAKRQAELIRDIPTRVEARASASNPEIAATIANQIPEASASAQRLEQASAQRRELERLLPQDRLKLEQSLSQNNFGQTPIEQNVLTKVASENEGVGQALGQAEAARTVKRIQTGNIEPSALEQIPLLGQTVFALRKAASPIAGTVLNAIAKAGPKTRRALISDIFDRVKGVEQISKAALIQLQKEVGPEAALVLYAQNGGDVDIRAAAEELGMALTNENSQGAQ